MSKSFQEQWPSWPPGYECPLQLVDVRIKLPVDKVFDLLYAPGSEFVARSQEVRGNKDYVESPWLESSEELSSLAQLSPPLPKHLQERARNTSEYKGLLRKTSCSSFGMGMKFRTEEVQRCLESQSGSFYEVEVCVATTATYGDKFRGVCRHRLQADGPQWSTWKAEFALVYINPVNGLLKKAIEKGSAGGLAKNFATLVEVLGEFAEVAKSQQEQAAAAGAPSEDTRPQAQQRVLGILDEGFVHLFEPVAATIMRSGIQQGASTQEVSRTATAIAVLVLLIMLQCLLAVVRMGLGSFKINPGWLGIPGSVSGVVFSIAVFILVQRGAPLLAAGIPSLFGRLPGFQRLRRTSRSLPSGVDADVPAKGTRFEGFDAALESANADIISGEQELRAASLANLALQRTAPAREQLKTGMKGFQKLMADTWTAGRRRMANGALTPERAISPAREQGSGKRLGSSRGSSPLPTSPKSEAEDTNALSDGAVQRRSPSRRRRRPDRRSDKALMKSFNAASRSSGDEAEAQRSVEMSAMGPRPASITSQTSSLSEYEGPGPVEAEVFENERFLPFRGWGHQWPGHLLPTDRVGHWSLRGDGPSGAESMDFHNVAPGLREGWEWLEEDWHIDMTGHEEGCVDDEGWYYAVDFNWLKHPPPPGAGRFKRVRDYVRRRRWVRTRVRSEALMSTNGALQRLASLSQPPPLLPLTELLGDMALTTEAQPLPRGPTASSEARSSAERLPFELRPGSSIRTSAELHTPRLVMGLGGERSPSAGAEEGPVLLRLSVRASGDATRDAGRVTVRLVLRQQQAAPRRSRTLPQRAVQQLVPAEEGGTPGRQLEPSGSGAHAGLEDSSGEQGDSGSPAEGEDDVIPVPGQPVLSSPAHERATGGPDEGLEIPPAHGKAAAAAEESTGTAEPIADPFAAAASPSRGQVAAEVGSPSDNNGGMLDCDLERVELQIAASMQPSSEDSGAAENFDVIDSQHSGRALESGCEEAELGPAPGEGIAMSGHASARDGGRLSHAQLPVAMQKAASTPEADAAQPAHGTLSSEREDDYAVAPDNPAASTKGQPPSTLSSEPEEPYIVSSKEARDLDTSAQPSRSAVSQEHAAKEHADWEHVRSASNGDTDHSGVVVHHQHTAHTDDDAIGSGANEAAARRGSIIGGCVHPVVKEGSSENAEVPLGPTVAPLPQSEDAPQAQEQQAPSQSSSSALARVGSSSPLTSPGEKDRQATPERRPHEGLVLFPRPAGDSSPGPSSVAVDWSQIGKKSGRLAAMAGDSLRKGFAQAASHASNAAWQSGKGEPKALSPPADKLYDQPSRRIGTIPAREQQAGGPSFLQTLKTRGEQSLHAARSVLSPDATGHRPEAAPSSIDASAAAEGAKGEHAAMGSMRGMFSDLKRTMERVGHAAPIMNMASFGKQDSVSLPRTSSEIEAQLMDQSRSTNVASESHDRSQADDLAEAKLAQSSAGEAQRGGKLKES